MRRPCVLWLCALLLWPAGRASADPCPGQMVCVRVVAEKGHSADRRLGEDALLQVETAVTRTIRAISGKQARGDRELLREVLPLAAKGDERSVQQAVQSQRDQRTTPWVLAVQLANDPGRWRASLALSHVSDVRPRARVRVQVNGSFESLVAALDAALVGRALEPVGLPLKTQPALATGSAKAAAAQALTVDPPANDSIAWEIGTWEPACRKGQAEACDWAIAYHETYADPPAWEQSAPLVQKACELGDAGWCLELGRRLYDGTGITKNAGRAGTYVERAVGLWSRACDKGSADACAELALLYEEGAPGVRANESRAQSHRKRACQSGDRRSCDDVLKDAARKALCEVGVDVGCP